MELLTDYARTLAIFMVFSAFVSIILPSGAFKKYIALILNIMLISLVLKPINSIVGSNSLTAFKFENILEERTDDKNLLSEYEKVINGKTAAVIYEKTGLTAVRTEAIVIDGQITDVFAVVALPPIENSPISIIAFGNAKKLTDKNEIKKAVSENIKNCLSDFYKLDEGNIHITVQDN